MMQKVPTGEWLRRDMVSYAIWWVMTTCLVMLMQAADLTQWIGLPEMTWGKAAWFVFFFSLMSHPRTSRYELKN